MIRSRTYSIVTAAGLMLLSACSSDNAPSDGPSAGAAGSAGSNAAGSGGSSAGSAGASAGSPADGGASGGASAGSGGAGAGGSSAGSGGTGGAAGSGPQPSTGCGKPAPQELTPEMYIRKDVPEVAKTGKGAVRVYELRLPKDYKPSQAYPVLFESHGCDGSIPFHIEDASGTKAIVVALRAADNQDSGYKGGCFATGPNDARLGELPYFDAVVAQLESTLCVDKTKLFMEGYSSGSWLTNLLGCTRAGVLRGQGNATGGLPKVPEMCAGPIAAMLVHDDTDDQNKFEEGIKARDRIKAINGCSDQTTPYQWDTNPNTMSTCVQYVGCKAGFPLIWCPTHNKGHVDQKPITTVGMWKFWSSLP